MFDSDECHDREDGVEDSGGVVGADDEYGDDDGVSGDPEIPGLKDFAVGEILSGEGEAGGYGIEIDIVATEFDEEHDENGNSDGEGYTDDEPVIGFEVGYG